MPANADPTLSTASPRIGDRSLWQTVVFVLCCLFGLSIILNTQPLGDGAWFWYAKLFHQGKHLYSGMHLVLQPLFIMETAAEQRMFGYGWLISKIPAAIHLFAYVFALWLIIRRLAWEDGQKAILLGSMFLLSIFFEAYRFDDYHVLADCFQLYSIYLLLRLRDRMPLSKSLLAAVVMGVLSGLAIVLRVNDGGLLLVTVALAILFCVPSQKMLHALLACVSAALVVVIAVFLTGDPIKVWFGTTILHAAASKGGTGHVLIAPLHLPSTAFHYLATRIYGPVALYALAVGFIAGSLIHDVKQNRWRRYLWQYAVAIACLSAVLPHFAHLIEHGNFTYTLCAIIVLVTFVVDGAVLVRMARWLLSGRQNGWDPRELILLVPAGQLISGSMSSGGNFIPLFTPIAVEFLLLALLFPAFFKARSRQLEIYLVFAVLVAAFVLPFKILHCFTWHTYFEKPLFTGRVWYKHPLYGPMLIDRDNLAFEKRSCDMISATQSPQVLSLPYPYMNYFCGISPWHDVVQTFFDTSGRETIDPLVRDLKTAPPQWIVYQRQLEILKMHEAIYNHGEGLPHRALDDLLKQRVESGQWKVLDHAALGKGADYYVIRTDTP
ncbi:hypothetical protein [Terriglobus saanensis]|uniref:Glycosyltransferase RgtA/B/C/D-like domain-containing protein n=1 Tax=Terriglobus saanensis (strain ATCC BAA-1853 / DSM 23119 / SP1PR4) TaxID=401053 RepID=E8V8P0_TERSS|nr:hypothetical protein [Terriglobus saanensis]ADV84077.1 hypothetical protein AciPR4_3323 [Terriglobus saanensis SP1PR4]